MHVGFLHQTANNAEKDAWNLIGVPLKHTLDNIQMLPTKFDTLQSLKAQTTMLGCWILQYSKKDYVNFKQVNPEVW